MHPKNITRTAPRFAFSWDPARNQMRVDLLKGNLNASTRPQPQQDQPDPSPTTRAASAQKAAQH